MKSYTDIEQSKKLAEFLPLESADMTYSAVVEGARDKTTIKGWEIVTGTKKWEASVNAIKNNSFSYRNGYIIPCWSLAALINIINNDYYTNIFHDGAAWNINIMHHDTGNKHTTYGNSLIDICYKTILKLY